MALGDGSVWNEALPDNDTVGHQIDDYNRDLRKGIRGRMAREHVWSNSQTATDEGGHHNFITFQAHDGAPTMAGTTAGGLYVDSATLLPTFVDSAGTVIPLTIATGTQGSIPIASSAGPNSLVMLVASAPGMTLHTNTGTGAPTWEKVNLSAGGQVTGTGIAGLKAYASDWTLISNATAISIAHNLALVDTTKVIVSILVAQDNAGAGARTCAPAAESGGNSYGINVQTFSTNTCVIQVGNQGIAALDNNGSFFGDIGSNFDYCRVNILAVV